MAPRVLIFDLETSTLDADFGTLLCVGYKWLGEKKVTVLSIDQFGDYKNHPTDDSALVEAFLKVYETADLTVAYNGILFDRPYLLAKCLEHNLPIPPSIPMQDPYFTVKSNLRISRKSLQNTAYFLRLSSKKTPVEGRIWKAASTGDMDSLKYIVKHCHADVKVLEELYLRIRPLMRTHYRMGPINTCRFCGATIHAVRPAIGKTKGQVIHVRCDKCLGWDTRTAAEILKLKLPWI